MMTIDSACPPPPVEDWTDEHVVTRVLKGEVLLFEVLMRRHNQRIYRAIRSILRDDSECEDAMQETYVSAIKKLSMKPADLFLLPLLTPRAKPGR